MELWQRLELELEQRRRAIPGGPQGWRPERLILRDWWHWREQEFGFAHGRLALTGQNAGGKSSLLGLMLPLLLDGRSDPVRLDPAQSRDRYLHYYLLGSDDADPNNPEAFRYDNRTGYIALEFYHVQEDRFLTIGMGVSASRTSSRRITDWWGFLLHDGQRIGRGFDVRGADETCLGRREFVRLVGEGGVVVTEKAEYQRLVNSHLFGLEPDDYQALIEMLLQARRPKLGEQSGPDKVCDLLRAALPGVPTERLTRVGEVVNNIEEYRRNLADVTAKAEAVSRIDRALLALAEALVQEAAGQYLSTQAQLGSLAGRLKEQRADLAAAERRLEELEQEERQRSEERAALEAEAQELREQAGGDLTERVEQARRREAAACARQEEVERRRAAQAQGIATQEREQEGLRGRFEQRRRELALRLDRLSGTATELAWVAGARELSDAARAVEVLSVEDTAQQLEGALPDLSTAGEVRSLRAEYRKAAEARRALDEAEREYRRLQADAEAKRAAVSDRSDQLEAARDQAEERLEELLAGLQQWRSGSSALQPGQLELDRVADRLHNLTIPPAGGFKEMIGPLEELAQRRHRELDQRLSEIGAEERQAGVRVSRLAEELQAAEADPGDPLRSELRARARRGLPDTARPLFRVARFRPEVKPETAALVEAALLEAGWLDLLVVDQIRDDAAVDAHFLPRPVSGPSLLEVLEPEPGAPPIVSQVLASVGWGDSDSPWWVSPDGRWQNGPATGTVAPWVTEPAGYLGEENRRRRRERRVEALRAALGQAEDELAAIQARREEAEALQKALTDELEAVGRLPWTRYFDALRDTRWQEQQLAQAREALEATRPALAAAEQQVQQWTRTFSDRADDLPGASGLTYEGLLERSEALSNLARDIEGLSDAGRELWQIADSFRSQAQTIRQAREALAGLQADAQQAQEELAAARAALQALERMLRDPAVRARQERLAWVSDRLQALGAAAEQARDERAELKAKRGKAQERITELEPQEAEARRELERRLERVRARLRLHPNLQPYLEALGREGPVNVVRRLPRPAEDGNCERLIQQRRGGLGALVREEMDQLREYRPSWNEDWTGITFTDERVSVSAHQLQERLAVRREQYEVLLEEEQRRLFEDIIYEGILDELRRLIRQAREFTRRTNEKLRALKISNGEQLSLRLSLLPPEQVPGARIAHELEQMEQGSRWLDEAKREILLSTIKEEVERVRASAEASGEQIGYQEAVTRALDYRNWYQYELLSKMPDSSRPVPIRTRGFGRRSTSAKAWALAVPVLAAVAARYDASPRPDVPRLIGLDEAFAGLDPNNQANYLGFLTQLDFCWVITAPDELPYSEELSAAMAYRMSLEGSFHTAFPILWNGQVAWEPVADWVRESAAGEEP